MSISFLLFLIEIQTAFPNYKYSDERNILRLGIRNWFHLLQMMCFQGKIIKLNANDVSLCELDVESEIPGKEI